MESDCSSLCNYWQMRSNSKQQHMGKHYGLHSELYNTIIIVAVLLTPFSFQDATYGSLFHPASFGISLPIIQISVANQHLNFLTAFHLRRRSWFSFLMNQELPSGKQQKGTVCLGALPYRDVVSTLAKRHWYKSIFDIDLSIVNYDKKTSEM